MIYIDENGNQIEQYDLSLGYLIDHEWIDHPEVAQSGHYEYNEDNVQTFVVDVPAKAPWHEVTVKRYVLYTQDELAYKAKLDYVKRLDTLECINVELTDKNNMQAVEIHDLQVTLEDTEKKLEDAEKKIIEYQVALEETQSINDMLMECVLEMSTVVYA